MRPNRAIRGLTSTIGLSQTAGKPILVAKFKFNHAGHDRMEDFDSSVGHAAQIPTYVRLGASPACSREAMAGLAQWQDPKTCDLT